ncbi:hypothetical protein AVEN_171405-1 [Araneus ventricosus]|uniref:Reverse transcriptase domain-containing protein n=1 Tax=Araneus ventricosus TaxID=182803 RepID=A0A4Y2D2C4_ARAVE|nr:hypothetical protein AVEN_171405-1 [Araneus ventricosus]
MLSTLCVYPNDNPRSNAMDDFISSTNLQLLNVKHAGPNFQQRNAKGWPELTPSIGQLSSSTCWEFLEDINFSRQVTLNTPHGPATLPQHRGCPQGSCTGPAYWNLAVKEVLTESWPQEVHLQAFADDFIFLIKAQAKAKLNPFRPGVRYTGHQL